MEKIHINLGKDSYDIVIDSGLIRHAGDAVSSLTGAHDAKQKMDHGKYQRFQACQPLRWTVSLQQESLS